MQNVCVTMVMVTLIGLAGKGKFAVLMDDNKMMTSVVRVTDLSSVIAHVSIKQWSSSTSAFASQKLTIADVEL